MGDRKLIVDEAAFENLPREIIVSQPYTFIKGAGGPVNPNWAVTQISQLTYRGGWTAWGVTR